MKLYYSKGTCSLAIRIIIHEIGIPCEYEAVNLQTKKTEKGTYFLTINPKGAVPTLTLENNETLTENTVIQQYLADSQQAHSLLPTVDDFNRYRVLEWLNFVSTDLHKNCSPLFNSNIPDTIKDEIFRPILKNKLNYIEQQLNQKTYLMGEKFTLPDGYLFVILRWLPNLKIELTSWPNLTRFFAQMKERKSVQEALKEEGL